MKSYEYLYITLKTDEEKDGGTILLKNYAQTNNITIIRYYLLLQNGSRKLITD